MSQVTAQDRMSIPSRRHVAGTRTDPRSHGGLKDDVRDQQLGCPVLRVRTVLPCPPLRLQGPCRNPDGLQFDAARFNFYAYCTFSGSSSGTTSEYPVSKAMGKIARREFARCAAIVSKTNFRRERPLEHGNLRDIAPQSFAYRYACGASQCAIQLNRYRTDLQLRHQSLERMQELASGMV